VHDAVQTKLGNRRGRRRQRPVTGLLSPDPATPAPDPAPSASATPTPPPQAAEDAIHRSVSLALTKVEGERRSERRALAMLICAVIGAGGTLMGGIAALVTALN
jgi:hypothetical protein